FEQHHDCDSAQDVERRESWRRPVVRTRICPASDMLVDRLPPKQLLDVRLDDSGRATASGKRRGALREECIAQRAESTRVDQIAQRAGLDERIVKDLQETIPERCV